MLVSSPPFLSGKQGCPPPPVEAKFKGGRRLSHPLPLHPDSAPPPPPPAALYLQEVSNLFSERDPWPPSVGCRADPNLPPQSKGKRERALCSGAFPGVEDKKRFPLLLLGKPPQMRHRHSLVAVSHWFLESSCCKAPRINPNRRKPQAPTLMSLGFPEICVTHVILIKPKPEVLKRALLSLQGLIGSPESCFFSIN